MTGARLDTGHEDRVTAREFVDQARMFLGDAASDGLSNESRSVLLHQAAVSACDAILQAAGLRVTSGDGAHALRLDEAIDLLAGENDELLERLHSSRSRRNEASYALGLVADVSLEEAREATTELIERAADFVGR